MPDAALELLKGTLDLLILRALELRPMQGSAIADRIFQVTRGTFQVKAGSLFPALHRLEQQGWVEGEWQETAEGRRVRSYTLTREGRKQLAIEKKTWTRIVTGHERPVGVRLTCALIGKRSGSSTICFIGRRAEDTLHAELGAYLDDMTSRNIASGMHRTRRAIGPHLNLAVLNKSKKRFETLGWAKELIPHCTISVMHLALWRAHLGFTIIVIATLALGISANLTIVSLMRAVLWRPLPYPEPNRIVNIRVDARNVANTGATRRELLSLQERSRCLEAVSTIDGADANLGYAGAE